VVSALANVFALTSCSLFSSLGLVSSITIHHKSCAGSLPSYFQLPFFRVLAPFSPLSHVLQFMSQCSGLVVHSACTYARTHTCPQTTCHHQHMHIVRWSTWLHMQQVPLLNSESSRAPCFNLPFFVSVVSHPGLQDSEWLAQAKVVVPVC
jgi:hypothetical protein